MHVKVLLPEASKGSYLTILLKNKVINYPARKYCSGAPLLQLLYVGSSTPVIPVVPVQYLTVWKLPSKYKCIFQIKIKTCMETYCWKVIV